MQIPSAVTDAVLSQDMTRLIAWLKSDPADPDQVNRILMWAAQYSLVGMGILIEFGADVNSRDEDGTTPLHYAAYANVAMDTSYEIDARNALGRMELLLDRGSSVDPRNVFGETPLMIIARFGTLGAARVLLSRGASLHVRNIHGQDAVDCAGAGRFPDRADVFSFLRDVRLAGGWAPFLRAPRVRLFLLRLLCERGRASAPSRGQLQFGDVDVARIFELPADVFLLILEFWTELR